MDGIFRKLALRDAIVLALVTTAWLIVAPFTGGTGPFADLFGVLLGIGFGISVFLLHEWGHLLGGLAAGSRAFRAPATLRSIYLFSYDVKKDGRGTFLAMSFGGFAVTGAALVVAYGMLPAELLATRVARGSVAFLASLTVLLEFPLVLVSLVRHQSLPTVEVFAEEEQARG